MLEFSSGMSKATIPFSMSDYESISVSRQIDLAAELTVANKVYRLARATLFLQDNNGKNQNIKFVLSPIL